MNARWTLKIGGKVRHRPHGTPLPMIAVPVFGYKSPIRIDRRHGFIRESATTSASAADGRRLRHLATTEDTASEVSFAALCGVSPVPASSGKTVRHRLNRGGDRAANSALHIIAIGRLCQATRQTGPLAT